MLLFSGVRLRVYADGQLSLTRPEQKQTTNASFLTIKIRTLDCSSRKELLEISVSITRPSLLYLICLNRWHAYHGEAKQTPTQTRTEDKV
jgi:hypothetical protein